MRALRIGGIVIVVLAVLFVAADRIAVGLAEDQAAQKIKSAQGVSSSGDVSVDIKGFPFLTQAADDELDRVDAELSDLPAQAGDSKINITHVNAHLRHVRLGDDFSSATAGDATGTAFISYRDLTKVAGEDVSVGWGGTGGDGRGRVKVTAGITIPVLDKTVSKSVNSTVGVSGGDTVRLHADKVPGGSLPGVEGAIRKKIDFSRKLTGLPSGMKLQKVDATKKGVRLSVRGSDVDLTG